MTEIRPISDLRNNFNAISETCHTEGVPVFITKNGHQNMVVMSHALFEEQQNLIELYRELAVAESESANPATPKKTHREVMDRLRGRIDGFRD